MLICTSGVAKKEVRNLKRSDFEGHQDPDGVTTFRVRRAKTGFDFYTFCTPGCTKAIYDYLKTLKDNSPYLFVSRNKQQIIEPGWTWVFKNLNRRLGFDRTEMQFSQTRSHNYRKYFQSILQNGGCPVWFVDFCMAHETSDVRAHYHLTDPDKLREIYKANMHLLAIDDRSFELMKDDEIKRLLDKDRKRDAELEEIKENNRKLMKKMASMEMSEDAIIERLMNRFPGLAGAEA